MTISAVEVASDPTELASAVSGVEKLTSGAVSAIAEAV